MIIGYAPYGRINIAAGEWIETRFLILGLPVLPLGSFHAVRTDDGQIARAEVNLHFGSMALGYLRWYLFIAGLVVLLPTIFYVVDRETDKPEYKICMAIVVSAFVLWAIVTFFVGRRRFK